MRFGSLLSVLLLCGSTVSALAFPPLPEGEALPESIRKERQWSRLPHLTGAIDGHQISRNGWTLSVDSEHPRRAAAHLLDDNEYSTWESDHSGLVRPHPHHIVIDMKSEHNVTGVSYLPRQDGLLDGNIGAHKISLSSDGIDFGEPVAFGTFSDNHFRKNTSFPAVKARFVRVEALSESGGRVPFTSAAAFHVYGSEKEAAATGPPNLVGKWSATINFPLVPAACSLDVNTGNILTWSAYQQTNFLQSNGSQTVTATYNPSTGQVSQEVVTNTHHDMFCPGISLDAKGQAVVTGGNTANRTSIYTPQGNTWFQAAPMHIPRGYQSSATGSDGRIFTIGGSWSGGLGGKNGEIYNPNTNTWTLLPGCPVQPMLTADKGGIYRQDNHGWLFGWRNGNVFQAGPSRAMNWYGTSGTGSQRGAGLRASDGDSMCGNAVMYGAVDGKILTLGGAPDYENAGASNAAHIITINTPGTTPSVQTIGGMAYRRVFANAIALPNGNVFVTGGQSYSQPFTDNNATMVPELWHYFDNTFHQMATGPTPRTYHSVALLMLDGRVFSGGGGLCFCTTNHLDAQIFSPPYLFNSAGGLAVRPVINSVTPSTAAPGATLTVVANGPIATMSLVRYGSATHTVDTDQRRIGLQQTTVGINTYHVVIPNDPGVALPGYWMLFAMNSAGTPSVAKTIVIT